jgi:UDP-2,3-diacylglucosamine hydrolase
MDVLLVSDAHVSHPDEGDALARFLTDHPSRTVVLLGDICDGWWCYPSGPREAHRPVLAAIGALSARGSRVVWVEGNRDFAHDADAARRAGYAPMRAWRDGPLLAFHGHDRGPWADRALASILRSRATRQAAARLEEARLTRLIDTLGAASRAAPAEVEPLLAGQERAVDAALARGARCVFTGHTHTPFIRQRPGGLWVNTGAWHGLGTWAEVRGDTVRLVGPEGRIDEANGRP